VKSVSLRRSVSLAVLMLLRFAGNRADAQDAFVTTNTLLNPAVQGTVYVGVNAVPPAQTVNTDPIVASEGSIGEDVQIYNSSTFDLGVGNVGGILQTHNRSVANITGGTVESGINAFDNSTVNMTGGSTSTLESVNNSVINIQGGAINGLMFAVHNSVINIFGGQISQKLTLFNSSRVNLFGTDLSSVLTNPNAEGNLSQYTLSGHLLDGTDVTGKQIFVANGDAAKFTINKIPFNLFVTADTLFDATVPHNVFVGVDALPPAQTISDSPTVRLVAGSSVSGTLEAVNSSTVNLKEGRIEGFLAAFNTSAIHLDSGYVSNIQTFDSSSVEMSGGYIGRLRALGNSAININGGIVGAQLNAQESSVVNIRGGRFAFIHISSGTFGGLFVLDGATINLFGTDLKAVLTEPNFQGIFSQYTLSGHLLDGTDVTGLSVNVSTVSNAMFTVNNVPVAEVTGRLTLQGMAASAPQQALFTFRSTSGGPAFSVEVTLNADHTFALNGIPRDHYTLHVKADKWLARNFDLDITQQDAAGLTATLRVGDANNDNRVDILDLGMLADAFNATPASPHWNANADFNGDGKVDITDLGLLANNFNTHGDP
jgi:hypothetical protein